MSTDLRPQKASSWLGAIPGSRIAFDASYDETTTVKAILKYTEEIELARINKVSRTFLEQVGCEVSLCRNTRKKLLFAMPLYML